MVNVHLVVKDSWSDEAHHTLRVELNDAIYHTNLEMQATEDEYGSEWSWDTYLYRLRKWMQFYDYTIVSTLFMIAPALEGQ